MTEGEQFIRGLALKSVFHDRHEQRAYGRALEIAIRLIDEPSLLVKGSEFLEQHVKPDPHQARYYRLWVAVLKDSPSEIARRLLEDSEVGAELRGSAPVFFVFNSLDARSLAAT